MGAMPDEVFELITRAFHVDPAHSDPHPGNNDNSLEITVGIFADGFESGDLSEWGGAGNAGYRW